MTAGMIFDAFVGPVEKMSPFLQSDRLSAAR
jgi:hypothetical protein